MNIKLALAVISIVLTLTGYFFYFRDIFAGKTKPHAYSWLVWGILTGIAFVGQLTERAGPGSYVTGLTAGVSFVIVGLALVRGEKNITRSDKVNLAAALLAIIPWLLTNDPLLSVVLVTVIDFTAFIPTIRKSYGKPQEETLIHYVLAGLKFAFAILALDNYAITTWLYPGMLVVANIGFACMLMIRRRQLAR